MSKGQGVRKRTVDKGKNGWGSIWAAYRYRAKKKGFKWELTREEFDKLIRQPCYYCGAEPTLENESNLVTVKGVKYYYSGIDRLDNEPIYSLDRCESSCSLCNRFKGAMTEKEFIKHVTKIATHNKRTARTKRDMDGLVESKRRGVQSRNKRT